MRFATPALATALIGLAAAAPFNISSKYGFPNPNATQLVPIQEKADGTLSNAPPPAKLNPASVPVFQVIAFNEEFEVAFFESLIQNITHNVEGFRLESRQDKRELLDVLKTVLAVRP